MKVKSLLRVSGAVAVIFIFARCNYPSQTPSKASATDSTDKFADNIRKTDFQSPEEERKSFRLPPGFEITLFAAEPDISKPINMEFDDRGRLWVTNTLEYPMPARKRKGRDHITILEDTDGDGKADKFTPFSDTLNIPIGITPVKNGAIAYSIPNLYRFTDSNNDGRADQSVKLIGPFEYEDTHGMVNNLIRGYDGWIHACHGYANNSTVAGSDGDSIHMSSGNTFRFREDGSRVEATTFGRINPFGYAFDEWGYLYSLDCHTKPVYQLIHGAQYPAQGKQEPSIGWAPAMMSYEFGSTANSGLVYYTGTQFPEEYKNNFFSGNVVTCRINRNTMKLKGSSPETKREEDFLVSEDPWFRPADLKTGPDGSIYVADFYNRIIGHYEVPKEHPARDRTSGRIWKITYTGGHKSSTQKNRADWSKASLNELISALSTPQLTTRMLLANKIVDAYAEGSVKPVQNMVSTTADSKSLIQGLWILYRLNALPQTVLDKALQHADPMVQVHSLRILCEMKSISNRRRELAIKALSVNHPQVQRIAAEVAGRFPQFSNLSPLLALYNETADQDTHLKYTTILSIIDHLKSTPVMRHTAAANWSDDQLKVLAFVMPEVASRDAANFSFTYLKTHEFTARQLETNLKFISRYILPSRLDELIAVAQQKSLADTSIEYKLYKSVSDGIAQSGGNQTPKLKKWGSRVAELGLIPSINVQAPSAPIDIEQLNKIIKDRLANFDSSAVTVAGGQQVFVNNCSVCHRIENNPGGSIGPQLSGIGTWGRKALTEKILNPNGNISTAYRTFNITLNTGKTLSGLYRREEGEVLIFANYQGEEFPVPKSEIRERVQSKYTLMPDNFRNTIARQDFDALLKYLLSIKENQ